MRRTLDVAKWALSLGREPQTFLGAPWVTRVLDRAPEARKRVWALRLLSLSPHYFINPAAPEYRGMTTDQYLEAAFQETIESRVRIYEQILRGRVSAGDVVLDYGCGPGVLAKVLAGHVGKVYACDISTGALACARVLSAAPNLTYVVADSAGLDAIADEDLDVVFSFAMVQHLSDEVFERVLARCRTKLKRGGRLILHIQLPGGAWRTEEAWNKDSSVKGRMRFRYGLHCFARTEDHHRDVVSRHGFEGITVENLADLVSGNRDEARSQGLLTATKGP